MNEPTASDFAAKLPAGLFYHLLREEGGGVEKVSLCGIDLLGARTKPRVLISDHQICRACKRAETKAERHGAEPSAPLRKGGWL